MTAQTGYGLITTPQTVAEAVAAMAGGAVPIAGATWLLRAPLRHEPMPDRLMSLRCLTEVQALDIGPERAVIGAMVTHDALAGALAGQPDLAGLATAAGASANPGIRRIATLGGNLGAAGFAASDLVPALLAADVTAVLATGSGLQSLPMAAFLAGRGGGGLILRVEIARSARRAAHARLPMRKAGDYPCAIVSVSADVSGGTIRDIRIAVGAVESTARRWSSLEDRLTGTALDPARAEAAAREMSDDFTARDAVDAPGWYRLSVLPVLLRRAFTQIKV
ncbi:MAG: FAD-binding molybdopterin dehydrogenase [Rhodobacteraceae bacterium PARR1]|nr:MAG: FAD-binding molybdopterin dehydrogenase [Rhodobacteraceae bacterium PARR1]